MQLDDYIEALEPDEDAERRRLAREKSYAITQYLEDFESRFERVTRGQPLFGSTAPSIFVGRSNYPTVSTGLLSPVGNEDRAAEFATDSSWYRNGFSIEDVFQYRTGLLNANRRSNVNVHDVWDGFVGVQREVAIADRPVDVEIGLKKGLSLDLGLDSVATPSGPRATAERASLAENPHVPRPVEYVLSDDDWRAEGAMVYLYRRGFDVYEINRILSAGALGEGAKRRLVPTRWSITAVDDVIGRYLRGTISQSDSIDETQVWSNEYMGNRYWIIMTPGRWEYELIEMKAPGSVWNPIPDDDLYIASDNEDESGRTGYVDGGTAGAYYAARLGVLEYLSEIDRQAKALVIRHVSDDYWGPVGVWQVRESVRHAFGDIGATAPTFHLAIAQILPHLPLTMSDLRRASTMVAGLQANLSDFMNTVK